LSLSRKKDKISPILPLSHKKNPNISNPPNPKHNSDPILKSLKPLNPSKTVAHLLVKKKKIQSFPKIKTTTKSKHSLRNSKTFRKKPQPTKIRSTKSLNNKKSKKMKNPSSLSLKCSTKLASKISVKSFTPSLTKLLKP
jgi:hypothetical protein